jgi:ubiquinone/menaquinone biosynthesis C-methylase UbiE
MTTVQDKWSEWLLEKRFGGDPEAAERGMRRLYQVRAGILDDANIAPGETVLDVGCGDGLIAFGALERVGDNGRVIFSDVSKPLLERCREIASELGVLQRCEFIIASAEDLSTLGDERVDVVTTRSVLIYVGDKARALREFHRVLRPGGRISLWEPINRFNATYEDERLKFGNRMPEIAHLWQRFDEHFRTLQPVESDPMMDFDQHDLLRHAEAAGFPTVHLAYHVNVSPAEPLKWEAWLKISGNPNIPTIGEALREIFSDDEFALFEQYARPEIERGGRPFRGAFCLLTATKATGG